MGWDGGSRSGRFRYRELPDQCIGNAKTLVRRELAGELLIEHLCIGFVLVAASKDRITETRFTHFLQQRLHEQRLELCRNLTQDGFAVRIRLGLDA